MPGVFYYLGTCGNRWTTLPSQFLSRGYLTLGTGKLYHPAHPNNGDGNASWSELPQQFSCTKQHDGNAGPPNTYCQPNAPACSDKGTLTTPNPRWCGIDLPLNGSGSNEILADAKVCNDDCLTTQIEQANCQLRVFFRCVCSVSNEFWALS